MKNIVEFIKEASVNFSEAVFIQASGAMNDKHTIDNVGDFVTQLNNDVNIFALTGDKVLKVDDVDDIKYDGPHFGADVIELAAKTIQQLKPGRSYFIGDSMSWTNKNTITTLNNISKVSHVVIEVTDLDGKDIGQVADLYKNNKGIEVFSLS